MLLLAESYVKIKKYLLKLRIWPSDKIQMKTVVILILQFIYFFYAIIKSIIEVDKLKVSDAISHCNGAVLVIAYCYILIKDTGGFSKLMCDLYKDVSCDMNEIEQRYMQEAGLELRRILKIGIFVSVCAMVVKIMQPFVLFLYNILFGSNGEMVLPPKPIIYNIVITYVMETTATIIMISSVIGLMTLFAFTILYLCAQCMALQEILAETQYSGVWLEWKMSDSDKLNRCIQRHIQLIELSKIMVKMYGPLLGFDCLLSSINICFILFSLASQLTVGHFFTEFPFLCAGVSQLFLANWFSDRLLTASIDVSLGAYSSRWPEMDKRYQRKILFIIQRSQKPMTLQYFGNFTPSLEMFLNICTTAWGYFNILREIVHST